MTYRYADTMGGSARYEIEHVSRYRYTAPVRRCVMSLCLRPRDDRGQRLLHFEIETVPPAPLSYETDSFGNTKHVLNVHREHEVLEVTTRCTVEAVPAAALPVSLDADAWEEVRSWGQSLTYWDFIHARARWRGRRRRSRPAWSGWLLRRLAIHWCRCYSCRMRSTIASSTSRGVTSAVSPIEHILESGRGVCQDYAHVMIAVARSWGVPARYVSGYMYVTDQAPETATHAWVECRLPDLGWVGLDPTNRRLADERYVRIAVGRDYQDVAPTRGVLLGGGDSQLEVDVWMRPLAGWT